MPLLLLLLLFELLCPDLRSNLLFFCFEAWVLSFSAGFHFQFVYVSADLFLRCHVRYLGQEVLVTRVRPRRLIDLNLIFKRFALAFFEFVFLDFNVLLGVLYEVFGEQQVLLRNLAGSSLLGVGLAQWGSTEVDRWSFGLKVDVLHVVEVASP